MLTTTTKVPCFTGSDVRLQHMLPVRWDKGVVFCPEGTFGAIDGAENQECERLEAFLAGSEMRNRDSIFISEIAVKVWPVWTSVSQTWIMYGTVSAVFLNMSLFAKAEIKASCLLNKISHWLPFTHRYSFCGFCLVLFWGFFFNIYLFT